MPLNDIVTVTSGRFSNFGARYDEVGQRNDIRVAIGA